MNSNNNPKNLANSNKRSFFNGVIYYVCCLFCCVVEMSASAPRKEDVTQKKVLNDVSIAFFEDEDPDDGIWRLRPVDSDGNAGPLKGGKGKL